MKGGQLVDGLSRCCPGLGRSVGRLVAGPCHQSPLECSGPIQPIQAAGRNQLTLSQALGPSEAGRDVAVQGTKRKAARNGSPPMLCQNILNQEGFEFGTCNISTRGEREREREREILRTNQPEVTRGICLTQEKKLLWTRVELEWVQRKARTPPKGSEVPNALGVGRGHLSNGSFCLSVAGSLLCLLFFFFGGGVEREAKRKTVAVPKRAHPNFRHKFQLVSLLARFTH